MPPWQPQIVKARDQKPPCIFGSLTVPIQVPQSRIRVTYEGPMTYWGDHTVTGAYRASMARWSSSSSRDFIKRVRMIILRPSIQGSTVVRFGSYACVSFPRWFQEVRGYRNPINPVPKTVPAMRASSLPSRREKTVPLNQKPKHARIGRPVFGIPISP